MQQPSFLAYLTERGAGYEVPVVASSLSRDGSKQLGFRLWPRRDGDCRRISLTSKQFCHPDAAASVCLPTWKACCRDGPRGTGSRGLLLWAWCRVLTLFASMLHTAVGEIVKKYIDDRVMRTAMAAFWNVSYSSDVYRAAAHHGRTIDDYGLIMQRSTTKDFFPCRRDCTGT